jgi:hypothetical protein
MLKQIAVCFLLLPAVVSADNLFLRNGVVYRNIEIIDTVGLRIHIRNGSIEKLFDLSAVYRIDRSAVVEGQRPTQEIFSQEMADRYRQALNVEENRKLNPNVLHLDGDSYPDQRHLDSLHSWRRSAYIAAGYGIPQGMHIELGFTPEIPVSFAVTFGIGDQWSRDAGEGMIGVAVLLRLPSFSSATTFYGGFMAGGTVKVFGGGDYYKQVCIGLCTPLTRNLQLRPEAGVAFTSRFVSGGTGLFGGTLPEVYDEEIKFYFNLALELDFR